ncbi:hypothetical protein ACVI1K_003591 [Bradyrhizobium sp. USDA 4508]
MHRKPPHWSKACPPRSSWPTPPMTPITCAKPSRPKARSPSFPTTRHARSNTHSTRISTPSVISSNAASQSSSSSDVSQPASKKRPGITGPSSLSLPLFYGRAIGHLELCQCAFGGGNVEIAPRFKSARALLAASKGCGSAVRGSRGGGHSPSLNGAAGTWMVSTTLPRNRSRCDDHRACAVWDMLMAVPEALETCDISADGRADSLSLHRKA